MPLLLNSKVSGIAIFSAIVAVGFFIYPALFDKKVFNNEDSSKQLSKASVLQQNKNVEKGDISSVATTKNGIAPEMVLIDAPFSSQAPYGNWGQPWQDACEETSVLMAVAWARGFGLAPAFAAEEIMKQVQFEERVFGYHRDTNLEDTARLIKDFYRYSNFDIRYDGVTAENIKNELASGNLVIVPLAGELLENPYFTSSPYYHMVVVRGYDDISREFIVNEPGTKYGNALRYRYDNLIAAIHNWTGLAATIERGKKAMIVVRPVLKK